MSPTSATRSARRSSCHPTKHRSTQQGPTSEPCSEATLERARSEIGVQGQSIPCSFRPSCGQPDRLVCTGTDQNQDSVQSGKKKKDPKRKRKPKPKPKQNRTALGWGSSWAWTAIPVLIHSTRSLQHRPFRLRLHPHPHPHPHLASAWEGVVPETLCPWTLGDGRRINAETGSENSAAAMAACIRQIPTVESPRTWPPWAYGRVLYHGTEYQLLQGGAIRMD